MTEPVFTIGDHVVKVAGYKYRGIVVGVIRKLSSEIRYVVENADGMLMIYNETQLRKEEACSS